MRRQALRERNVQSARTFGLGRLFFAFALDFIALAVLDELCA